MTLYSPTYHAEQCVLMATYILAGGVPDVTVSTDDVRAMCVRHSLGELREMARRVRGRKGRA